MKPAGQVTVWKQENEAAVGNGVDAVVNFFASVAAEEGWQPDGELDAYRSRSTYFALTGDDGTVAGGLQLIAPCPERTLPCVKVWPELVDTFKASQETITHVALLAVAKEWRGRKPGSGGLGPRSGS